MLTRRALQKCKPTARWSWKNSFERRWRKPEESVKSACMRVYFTWMWNQAAYMWVYFACMRLKAAYMPVMWFKKFKVGRQLTINVFLYQLALVWLNYEQKVLIAKLCVHTTAIITSCNVNRDIWYLHWQHRSGLHCSAFSNGLDLMKHVLLHTLAISY